MYLSLADMNCEQLMAIKADKGNLLIHAGAGTGKTTTIAARIVYLQIVQGISPNKIKAMSFSNSAKDSLRKKLNNFIKSTGQGSEVEIFTFHSFAFQILLLAIKEGLHSRKYPPTIVSNTLDLFYEANRKYIKFDECEMFLRAIHYLQQGKNEKKEVYKVAQECPQNGDFKLPGISGETIYLSYKRIYKYWINYQKKLKQNNLIDFPSIITEAISILSKPKSNILGYITKTIDYLIVDEYQDTSLAQEELLFTIANSKVVTINAVGDSRQTIFSFNGSTVENILSFEKKMKELGLPVMPSIELKENYRSGKQILELANHTMNFSNVHHSTLTPSTDKVDKDYEQVFLIKAPNFALAKSFVGREIRKLLEEGIQPGEIAILVRKNSEHYPYADQIAKVLEEEDIPFLVTLNKNNNGIELYEKLAEICAYYPTLSFNELINTIKQADESIVMVHEKKPLLETLLKFRNDNLESAYDVLLLISEMIDNPDSISEGSNKVFINTIHSSKGLEFPYVFLLYLSDRSFPHGKYPDVEEERRLLHVGITRAMNRVYVIGKPGVLNHSFWDECNHPVCNIKEYNSEVEEEKIDSDKELTEQYKNVRQKMIEEEESIFNNFEFLWDD
jgi:DNA helicase II / ATP-dependent DNA helicase PcrA